LLPLREAREDRRRIDTEPLPGKIRKLLQQRSLVAPGQPGADRVEIKKIAKLHRSTRYLPEAGHSRIAPEEMD